MARGTSKAFDKADFIFEISLVDGKPLVEVVKARDNFLAPVTLLLRDRRELKLIRSEENDA